jgi:hypothetical protein
VGWIGLPVEEYLSWESKDLKVSKSCNVAMNDDDAKNCKCSELSCFVNGVRFYLSRAFLLLIECSSHSVVAPLLRTN